MILSFKLNIVMTLWHIIYVVRESNYSVSWFTISTLNFEGREFRQHSANFFLHIKILDTDSAKRFRIHSSLESFDFMRNYLKDRGSITTSMPLSTVLSSLCNIKLSYESFKLTLWISFFLFIWGIIYGAYITKRKDILHKTLYLKIIIYSVESSKLKAFCLSSSRLFEILFI